MLTSVWFAKKLKPNINILWVDYDHWKFLIGSGTPSQWTLSWGYLFMLQRRMSFG